MERFRNALAEALFGRTRTENQCVSCGSDKVQFSDFRDDISRKEFNISRMCQKCQDDIFSDPLEQ